MKIKIIRITYIILILLFIMTTYSSSQGISKNIEVVFNGINLEQNGKKIDNETILYNDRTYIQLRTVAEIFDKEIIYNSDTYTANIIQSSEKMLWPTGEYMDIVKGFNKSTNPVTKRAEFHTGIDISLPIGSPVFAVKSGKVLMSGNEVGYGKTVIILHDDNLCTLYAQCDELLVKAGQKVNKGEIIAKSGTSNISEINHLHFEVRAGIDCINPLKYFID